MKFLSARVTKYRSIEDSTRVEARDVLALVGKNESGKTTFLQALEKLNAAEASRADFDPIKDYPRRELTKYMKVHEQSPATVVSAEFELTPEEIAKIEAVFGRGVLKNTIVSASKNYKNERTWAVELDEAAAIKTFARDVELPVEASTVVNSVASFAELIENLEAINDKTDSTTKFIEGVKKAFPKGITFRVINEHLVKLMPRFVYFGDYFIMGGTTNIQDLMTRQKANPPKIRDADRTFLALLSAADAKLEDFLSNQSYESLKAKLEGASASITDQVFEYWSQNKQLQVEFDVATGTEEEEQPFHQGTNLHVRIRNDRHRVTVPFDERSRGFVWFFSFLAYFSKLEDSAPGSLVLLLDEPGLNLHGKAQGDLLRFIDEKLASRFQVLYTTHSPFMIAPGKFERVRTVQDVDGEGTVVSQDVLKNDKDTLFPLQAALGYELFQTLFIGPDNLLVEGPSDLIYLQMLDLYAKAKGLQGLDPAWVVVPTGGADKIATFVTLFGGNSLNVAVLMDVASKDRQRIENLQANALLGKSALVQINEFTGTRDADIEDIFTPQFYLDLVNGAYKGQLPKPLQLGDLPAGTQRITKKVEQYFKENAVNGGTFSHYAPAEFLIREQAACLSKMDAATLKRAEQLFTRINGLLPAYPAAVASDGVPVTGYRPVPKKNVSAGLSAHL